MATNPSFDTILDALLDSEKPFPGKYLVRFSDLAKADAEMLAGNWPQISSARKLTWLEDLEDLSETDTTTSFYEVGRLAIVDHDPRIRELGIRLLWENEETQHARVLLGLLARDPDAKVQAAAAGALGHFLYLAEMDRLSASLQGEIETILVEKYRMATDPSVRRRAIESLGYSSTPLVSEMIRQAYQDKDLGLRASAVCAMGHSADDSWQDAVLSNLDSSRVEMQLEAVRAAGELELAQAREPLLGLLEDGETDADVFLAAVWSLSQMGGEGVREKLEELSEDEDLDDDTIDLIDDALENLLFSSSLGNFSLMDFEDEGPDDE